MRTYYIANELTEVPTMLDSNSIAENNKKIIQSYFLQMWNQRDTALIDELVAENYAHYKPNGDVSHGRDHIKEIVQKTVKKYPDIQFSIKHIVAEGDMVATLLEGEGTDKETHEVKYFKEAFFHRFKDSKMFEGWIIF